MKGWRHRCRSNSVGLCAALVVGVAPGALAAEVTEPAAIGSQWWPGHTEPQRFAVLTLNGAYRLIEGEPSPRSVEQYSYDMSP